MCHTIKERGRTPTLQQPAREAKPHPLQQSAPQILDRSAPASSISEPEKVTQSPQPGTQDTLLLCGPPTASTKTPLKCPFVFPLELRYSPACPKSPSSISDGGGPLDIGHSK